ncbi:MAG TPA: hypothetical protein VHI71_10255 [Actinomycetota bacterium]|nr:hypothetical protein [Actinomycetota bacterium]
MRRRAVRLARAQGLFNVVGGAWPIVWLRSFEWVFGRKHDVYLQKTSGAFFLASGLALLRAEPSDDGIAAARRIGIGAAAVYLAIDLIYVPKREIPKTYLLDALMEAGWIYAWVRTRPRARLPEP